MEALGDGAVGEGGGRGCPSVKIVKVKGSVGKKRVMILINNGSTHNFLDEDTALNLQCLM